ncbi:MAG: Ribosome-binding factor [Candidatus Paceibacter sp.]|jgi:ribosome-binding factor A|nr:Ribosome-binding factor [Candidatus Paceibacter sp.]
MPDYKDIKLENLIRELAASFLQRESNGSSLVTVTRVVLTDRVTKATILLSVLPEDKEEEAIEFARRKRGEFKEYVKKNSRIGRIPLFDFEIDIGEKNRQRIDELSTK